MEHSKDNPEWTEQDIKRVQGKETLPAGLRKKLRGPQKAPGKRDESATHDDGQVLLELQRDQLIVVASINEAPDQHFRCLVSNTRLLLEQEPLTEVKLESAIAQIEEQIMPILRALPAHANLKVSGFELERILDLLPERNDSKVPIESVEALFNELADYAGGSPVAWHHPLGPLQAALSLVCLREVMHHGSYRYVS